jgi:hypothetical protein
MYPTPYLSFITIVTIVIFPTDLEACIPQMNHSYFDNSLAVGLLHPLSCKHFMHNQKKRKKKRKNNYMVDWSFPPEPFTH